MRKQFGNRFLKNEDDVFKYNAWCERILFLNYLTTILIICKWLYFYLVCFYYISRDNVEWNEAQESQALSQVCEHVKTKMSSEKADDLENNANQYWDKFYSIHQEKYVK